MCEEITGMEATDDIPGTMDVTQKATETPTEELLRVCFVPTMEDEWYEDQYCASSNGTERWLADTGATTHITMTDEYMTNVENVNVSVIVGDGKEVVCTKRGDILITNKTCSMLLRKVLYTPHFHKNIVSIGQFVKNGGCEARMKGSELSLHKEGYDNELTFSCEDQGVLYYFKGKRTLQSETVLSIHDSTTNRTPDPTPTNTKTVTQLPTANSTKKPTQIDINEAHDKYGHISEASLRATLKSLGIEPTGKIQSCEGCALAKAKAKAVPKITTLKASTPAERLYVDISGPYKKSLIGSNYWILFVDQYTGKAWSYFVNKKSLLASIADALLTTLKSAGYVVRFLRCDNAGENMTSLSIVCTTQGIQIEYTAPHTPQQNGVVERKFVTIRDRACASMFSAKLSDEYQGLLWAESVHMHTRLTNSVANSNTGKCPDWLFYGFQPKIYPHLIQFGRVGWATIRTPRQKLTPKSVKCVMLGYSHDHAGDTYRMYNVATKKVFNTRDLKWADWHGNAKPTADMDEFTTDGSGIDEEFDTPTKPSNAIPPDEQGADTQLPTKPDDPTTPKGVSFADSVAGGMSTNEHRTNYATKSTKLDREMNRLSTGLVTSPTPTRAGTRQQSSAARTLILDDDTNENLQEHEPNEEAHSTSLASDPLEPKSYKQALLSNEKDEWTKAIKAEIENFYSRKVWKLYPRKNLSGRKPLGAKWVFKKKNEHDNTTRYKGRIVVKGYVQIPGVDFTDSFAPVVTDTGLRIVFALTLHRKDFVCEIVDIEAAFLEADLDEEIYIEWPDGIADFHYENETTMTDNCIRLDKAMYGTVQAARQWFKKLRDCLLNMGLKQSRVDPCVFYEKREGILTLLLCTYVDDLAVTGTQADVNKFKLALKQYFNVKELGQLRKHLGVWYEWGEDENGRYLQSEMEDFVKDMINDYTTIFGKEPKKASTPGFPGTVLSKNRGETIKNKEYRSLVGKILYFVKKISPVCANACRELSQHLDNPGETHWQALERLLGYLCLHGDIACRMKLRAPNELRIQDVVDSAFASNPDTRKSVSGYLGTIGGCALIHWISKGQDIVTQSSTECEYVALSNGSKETVFATNLLGEITTIVMPSLMGEDNTGAIYLTKNHQVGARTKHIDVRYHYVREQVENGTIKVDYVNTEKNPADVLTKNVTDKIMNMHGYAIQNGMMDCWNKESVKVSSST